MQRAALAIDLAAVLVFVAIGRTVHTGGLSFPGMTSTGWPFASGLVLGWLALVIWGWSRTSLRAGLLAWVCTVAGGMSLRVLSGQGIAFAFVLVAMGFFGAMMLGWRMLLAVVGHLRFAKLRRP